MTTLRTRAAATLRDREGFTLIEVLIAMVIMTVGLLAMAGLTAFITLQLRVSQMRAERMTALQQRIEWLRSTDYATLATRAKADADTAGDFIVWWNATSLGANLTELQLYTEGPGYLQDVGWSNEVQDTFIFTIAR